MVDVHFNPAFSTGSWAGVFSVGPQSTCCGTFVCATNWWTCFGYAFFNFWRIVKSCGISLILFKFYHDAGREPVKSRRNRLWCDFRHLSKLHCFESGEKLILKSTLLYFSFLGNVDQAVKVTVNNVKFYYNIYVKSVKVLKLLDIHLAPICFGIGSLMQILDFHKMFCLL